MIKAARSLSSPFKGVYICIPTYMRYVQMQGKTHNSIFILGLPASFCRGGFHRTAGVYI